MLNKTCKSCGETKTVEDFYKKTKTTYRSLCKPCANKHARAWCEQHPEKRREIAARSQKKLKNKRVEATIRHQQKYPEKYLWRTARDRANKLGIQFDIVPEDISIPDVCPVFGIKFERNSKFAMSLDRIDSSRGYVKGNIQVLSRLANMMKSNSNSEEQILFAKWILNGFNLPCST